MESNGGGRSTLGDLERSHMAQLWEGVTAAMETYGTIGCHTHNGEFQCKD